jgi:hypothetical protein
MNRDTVFFSHDSILPRIWSSNRSFRWCEGTYTQIASFLGPRLSLLPFKTTASITKKRFFLSPAHNFYTHTVTQEHSHTGHLHLQSPFTPTKTCTHSTRTHFPQISMKLWCLRFEVESNPVSLYGEQTFYMRNYCSSAAINPSRQVRRQGSHKSVTEQFKLATKSIVSCQVSHQGSHQVIHQVRSQVRSQVSAKSPSQSPSHQVTKSQSPRQSPSQSPSQSEFKALHVPAKHTYFRGKHLHLSAKLMRFAANHLHF